MSTVFGSTQSHSSPTSHRALIPSSSDEVSSDSGGLEVVGSNGDNEDSSQVEDKQEQSGDVRGRGCMQPRRRGHGRRPGRGRGRGGPGTSSQAMCGMGIRKGLWRATSGITQDQLILNGPWQRKESTALNYRFRGGEPGPTFPVNSSRSTLDFFSRFFTDEVWELIVTHTNRYAARLRQQSHHASIRVWHDVSVIEMKAFIGILIRIGICRLPRLRLYWTTRHPYIFPRICEVMSLTRFEQIYRFLDLCDSDKEVVAGQPGYVYLFKVRNLLDLLSPRFLSQYQTHEELSVDEAMIPFKGRLSIK